MGDEIGVLLEFSLHDIFPLLPLGKESLMVDDGGDIDHIA